ncbi:MAG: hypothetical protein ABI477_11560 [Chryseolinea sp.]
MKLKVFILTLGLGGPLLLANISARAQDVDASEKKVEQLESQLAEEKNKNDALKVDQTTGDLKDLKKAHKAAKKKSKEARSVQHDANNAQKEAKQAYKSEKKAQKARRSAEKQAEKARKAKTVSDGNH